MQEFNVANLKKAVSLSSHADLGSDFVGAEAGTRS